MFTLYSETYEEEAAVITRESGYISPPAQCCDVLLVSLLVSGLSDRVFTAPYIMC